ncbi:MAG: leucine-rich repeat domain-containing protein [Promethearchaeota archaeon]
MNNTSPYLEEYLKKANRKERQEILKEIITNSNEEKLRKRALELMSKEDEGKEFPFFSNLFISDESEVVKQKAGEILIDHYLAHPEISSLFRHILFHGGSIEQKCLILDGLAKMDNENSLNLLKQYVNFLFNSWKGGEKVKVDEISSILSKTSSFASEILMLSLNLTLREYYMKERGYSVTLKNGKIILLNCESSNLKEIPEIKFIEKLTDLEHLLLQKNHIMRLSGLNHLKKLKTLNLNENAIERIENLEGLSNLEVLDLSHNRIKTIENLSSLKSLKKLILDHNQIEKIKGLENLEKLEELSISNNRIRKIENLNHLINLKNLNLSFNQIKKMNGFENLTNLIWLHLNNNKLLRIKGLRHNFLLKGLYLSNNAIERIENLEKLENLKKLELSNNRIKKIEGLDNLKNLQELFLDRNLIQEMEGLEQLKSLIILFLERNNISQFKGIEDLRNLNFIFLNDNPLTQQSKRLYDRKNRYP